MAGSPGSAAYGPRGGSAPADSLTPGANRAQVRGGGEAGHLGPDLGEDDVRCGGPQSRLGRGALELLDYLDVRPSLALAHVPS
jgi:hypothetical protein